MTKTNALLLLVCVACQSESRNEAVDSLRSAAVARTDYLDPTRWEVDSQVSAVDGFKQVTLSLRGIEVGKSYPSYSVPALTVWCRREGPSVGLMSFLYPAVEYGPDRAGIRWRINGGEVQVDTWRRDLSGIRLLADNGRQMLATLLRSDTLAIEIVGSGSGSGNAIFSLSKLRDVASVYSACGPIVKADSAGSRAKLLN